MFLNNHLTLDNQSLPELLVLNMKEVGGLHKEQVKKNLRLLLRQGNTLPTALDMDMCACHARHGDDDVFYCSFRNKNRTNVHLPVSR